MLYQVMHALCDKKSISTALPATYGLPTAKQPWLFVGLTIVLAINNIAVFFVDKGEDGWTYAVALLWACFQLLLLA